MTPNLPRRKRARLSLQQPPLRHAGRADPQSPTNRPDRLAGLKALKRSFAKFFSIRSGHPCWPHIPSMDLESHLSCFANPDSAKNQRALRVRLTPHDRHRPDASGFPNACSMQKVFAKMARIISLPHGRLLAMTAFRPSANICARSAPAGPARL